MQFEIVLLLSALMVIFVILGLVFKNLVFGGIGAVTALFLGISLAGGGVIFTRIVNDTLTHEVIGGGFTAGFGALLVCFGIYLAFVMVTGRGE